MKKLPYRLFDTAAPARPPLRGSYRMRAGPIRG
jgi:hypothetical protein